MTIEAVKAVIEDVLEEAGALSAQDGIACHRLEIAIGRIAKKHFYLPLAFGIVGVAMRVNFSGEIVDVLFPNRRLLQIKQSRSGDSFRVCIRSFSWSFVEIARPLCAFADDLEMVVIITAIEGEVKRPERGSRNRFGF